MFSLVTVGQLVGLLSVSGFCPVSRVQLLSGIKKAWIFPLTVFGSMWIVDLGNLGILISTA